MPFFTEDWCFGYCCIYDKVKIVAYFPFFYDTVTYSKGSVIGMTTAYVLEDREVTVLGPVD
jgi:hypothetical protein